MTVAMLPRLAKLLGDSFYFDVETAEEALRLGRSFNIMSKVEVLKFDFFPAGADAFGAAQLARKEFIDVPFLSEVVVPVTSPEDVVLAKLRWYTAIEFSGLWFRPPGSKLLCMSASSSMKYILPCATTGDE